MSSTATETPPPGADDSPEGGKWIENVPDVYGLRDALKDSPYRWCARESSMWGIATAAAMGVHRVRMGSRIHFAVNVGFLTFFLVSVPSYYFCFKARENKEKYVELMMRANAFEQAKDMPEEPPVGEDHPFLQESKDGSGGLGQELVGELPERKEWQPPLPQQDAKDVFQHVPKRKPVAEGGGGGSEGPKKSGGGWGLW